MTKRMLIDASHAEETRVVVLDGNRLEEFDLEAATRKPLKGNIYLAKVVRVEPSLQAAFVEYGGNRHGFLAFSEIHPDYYQIPVADRQRLLQMQADEAREAEEAEDDPIPESPMDRAAAEDLRSRPDVETEEGDEAATAAAPGPDGPAAAEAKPFPDGPWGGAAPAPAVLTLVEAAPIEAAPAEAARSEAARSEAEQGEADPPPAIASSAAAESEVGGAAAPATTEAAIAQDDPAPFGVSNDADAPAFPSGGEVDADAEPRANGFDAAPAEALAGGEDAETAAPRRDEGEPRQARRRDSRGRGRRDDRGSRRREEESEEAGDSARAPREANESTRASQEDGYSARAARDDLDEEAPPETIGGEGPEDADGGREERRIPPRFLRHYKIQEVIKRRQIMLVQVVKEERGTKGAALTTYISLAGRFSVLMPNSPRGGGVSRKITSAADRKRLREVIDELSLPDGMSLIVRTAGAQRPKPEIRRDCEYLLRLWDNIRERTLASSAAALIYEEADLIKRSIRDVFSRDVEEIVVEGEDAYQEARDFMRMLMPQHVKKIQYAREGGLFARAQVEQQLDAMHSPTVQLKSGGYIVINQTEALVAIDVNSGRATRERHIEDTALRTNLEASDEIARQLRLRDLAGLIVIDFIDMESPKNDAMVERRLKEALRHDRARIQVGRISHFGLLEMSRQRLRPSLAETSFVTCPHCEGRGTVRSLESSALTVLRAIEEEGARRRAAEISVHVCSAVALYLLNRKRDRLTQIEEHFGMAVLFEPDETLSGPLHRIERLRAAEPAHARALPAAPQAALRMDYAPEREEDENDDEDESEATAEMSAAPEDEAVAARQAGDAPAEARGAAAGETQDDAEGEGARRRRRRRRRRGGPRPEGATGAEAGAASDSDEDGAEEDGAEDEPEGEAEEAAPIAEREQETVVRETAVTATDGAGELRSPRRRRGRRGSGPRADGAPPPAGGEAAPRQASPSQPPSRQPGPPPAPPRYMGPTPADPFAGHVDDILAAMEAAEAAAEAAATSRIGRLSAAAPAVEPQPAPITVQAALVAEPARPVAVSDAAIAPAEAPLPAPADPAPADIVADGMVSTEATGEPAAAAPAQPVPEPQLAMATPEATLAEPAADDAPIQGAAVQPKVLGEAATEAPRRGGWWRR